jgi:hypothetical protein
MRVCVQHVYAACSLEDNGFPVTFTRLLCLPQTKDAIVPFEVWMATVLEFGYPARVSGTLEKFY